METKAPSQQRWYVLIAHTKRFLSCEELRTCKEERIHDLYKTLDQQVKSCRQASEETGGSYEGTNQVGYTTTCSRSSRARRARPRAGSP